jgi:hypothetical protein
VLWPGIAERMGLDTSLVRFEAGRIEGGAYANIHAQKIVIGRDHSTLSDDALALVIGHEAAHIKYDTDTSINYRLCSSLYPLPSLTLRGGKKGFNNEQQIITEFVAPYYSVTRFFKNYIDCMKAFAGRSDLRESDDIEKAYKRLAGAVGCALNRLVEFRADRLGCEAANISDCAAAAREFLRTADYDGRLTHPSDDRRIAALASGRPTPSLRGGMQVANMLWASLDITGKFTDVELESLVPDIEIFLGARFDLEADLRLRWSCFLPPLIAAGVTTVAVPTVILCCIGKKIFALLRCARKAA